MQITNFPKGPKKIFILSNLLLSSFDIRLALQLCVSQSPSGSRGVGFHFRLRKISAIPRNLEREKITLSLSASSLNSAQKERTCAKKPSPRALFCIQNFQNSFWRCLRSRNGDVLDQEHPLERCSWLASRSCI